MQRDRRSLLWLLGLLLVALLVAAVWLGLALQPPAAAAEPPLQDSPEGLPGLPRVEFTALCVPADYGAADYARKGLTRTAALTDEAGGLWEFWSGGAGWAVVLVALDPRGRPWRCVVAGRYDAGAPS